MRKGSLSSLAVVASVFMIVASTVSANAGTGQRHPTSEVDWLSMVNFYRQQAGLAGLTEDHVMSDAQYLHAIYSARNDVVGHEEDPSKPYYTDEGHRAAQSSNGTGYDRNNGSERAIFSRMLLGPVHGMLVMNPHRSEIGYGFYREDPGEGSLQMAISIGHWDPISTTLPSQHFPVMWPGPGAAIPYLRGSGESPDIRPLCGFPADDIDWGPPVYFVYADAPNDPTAHSFKNSAGQGLPHCITRSAPWDNAIFITPHDPLTPGETYTASMTVDGEVATTTFTVTPFLMTACQLSVPAGTPVTPVWATFRDNSYMPGNYAVGDYPYGIVWYGDETAWEATYTDGPEPNTFMVTTPPKTYQNPGTYTFEVKVTDPNYTVRTITGTITVTAPGTSPSAPTCTPPPLPPAPAFPSPRPPASSGGGEPTESPTSSTHSPPPTTSASPSPSSSTTSASSPDPSVIDEYRPSLSLKLSRHLKARGVLTTTPAYAACTVGQTVTIDRSTRRGWKTVKTTSTNSTGLFKARLRDRPGKYRAYFEGFYVDDTNVCFDGFSRSVRHTH